MRQKFIEVRADSLLHATSQMGPPANLERVAKRLAVALRRGAQMDVGQRGHFDPDTFTIYVAALPPAEERFALAHELGHVALDHGGACSFEGYAVAISEEPDLQEMASGLDHEAEANEFAGRLLVPRPWLADSVDTMGVDRLVALFGVSRSVLFIRALRYRLDTKLRTD
jgi:Zn-dependent peptidase ImmA (M78 family)